MARSAIREYCRAMRRLIVGFATLAGISLAPVTATAAPPAPLLGGIEESGCLASTAVGGCTAGVGLGGTSPRALAVSPDGRNLYYTAGTSNTVAAMQRDAATGQLRSVPDDPATQGDDGCVGDGTPGAAGAGGCVAARVLQQPNALAITPDGLFVYVTSQVSDSVSALPAQPHDRRAHANRGRPRHADCPRGLPCQPCDGGDERVCRARRAARARRSREHRRDARSGRREHLRHRGTPGGTGHRRIAALGDDGTDPGHRRRSGDDGATRGLRGLGREQSLPPRQHPGRSRCVGHLAGWKRAVHARTERQCEPRLLPRAQLDDRGPQHAVERPELRPGRRPGVDHAGLSQDRHARAPVAMALARDGKAIYVAPRTAGPRGTAPASSAFACSRRRSSPMSTAPRRVSRGTGSPGCNADCQARGRAQRADERRRERRQSPRLRRRPGYPEP